MHQVVTAQLAARRAGTQSTLTRAEVRGGGAKPWRQKGTGRARQGSTRSPQWRGGGVALGPKPRSYAQRTPKKMIRLALRSALSDRAADGKVVVVDEWGFEPRRRRTPMAALSRVGARRPRPGGARRPRRRGGVEELPQPPDVHCCWRKSSMPTTSSCSDWVVFTRATVPTSTKADAEPVDETPEYETPVEITTEDEE